MAQYMAINGPNLAEKGNGRPEMFENGRKWHEKAEMGKPRLKQLQVVVYRTAEYRSQTTSVPGHCSTLLR